MPPMRAVPSFFFLTLVFSSSLHTMDDTPALNGDGTLKDASDITWHHSETDEAPIPNGAALAPRLNDGQSPNEELVAPGCVASSVQDRGHDRPNPALILAGSRRRKPTARVRDGKQDKPGDGLRRDINNFFHPKDGRCVVLVRYYLV